MTDHDDDLFARALAEAPVQLSAAGRARRAAIGDELRAAARGRRRRRVAVRTAAAAAVLLAAVAWWRARGDAALPVRIAPERDLLAAVRVHDDPTVLARCTVHPSLHGDVLLDDDALLALLADAGRPTGLIRKPGGVILTADVTDRIGE